MLPRLVMALPPASLAGILPGWAEAPEEAFTADGSPGIAGDPPARPSAKMETGP